MTLLYTEPRRPGEFLLSEANSTRSRDVLEIGAEQEIVPGTVLGYTPGDPEANPPTEDSAVGAYTEGQTIVGIAYAGVTTGEGETADVVAVTRDAEVKAGALVYPEGQGDAVKEGLAALGIIVRESL